MTDKREQPNPIEQALQELQAADRAGVFNTTPLDVCALLEQPVHLAPSRSRFFLLRRIAVAAVVLIAVSMWGWEVSRQGVQSTSPPTVAGLVKAASLSQCLTGPAGALDTGCDPYDYDADGHVDLADISSFQLAYASPSH